MKISFENKILVGFIINLGVVASLYWAFIPIIEDKSDDALKQLLKIIIPALLLLSAILLTIVYFIIRKQFRIKSQSQQQLLENKKLLQSIIDNTSSPIFIKKLSGEYIFVNKECEKIFQIPIDNLIGKTDYDILPKDLADVYRNSDLEVVKALRELKTEETIKLPEGKHTYMAIKFPIYDSAGKIYAIGGIFTDITKRKNTEETLKASDTFFNMALDIMVIATGNHFTKINPTMSQILGYTEQELLSQPFYNFIHPDDIAITKKEFEKLQKGVKSIQFENRWLTKNKEVKWLIWAASLDIATNRLYAIAHDITERKELEDSLKISENFFNMSFDALAVGKGQYFIKVNPAFTRIFGYTQDEISKTPYYKLATNQDRSLEAMKKLEEGGELVNFTNDFLTKDGTKKWLNWNAVFDKESGLLYGVCRDITQAKNDEDKLKLYTKTLEEDEQQIETLFDGAPDPVIVINSESEIIRWNPMAEKTFGWTKTEVLGKPIFDFILPEKYIEDHKKGMKRYLSTGVGPILNKQYEMEARNKAGKEFPVSLSVSPVKIADSILFIGFVRDITKNKKMLDELYENEETLRLIIENIGDGILVANSERVVVMANERTNQIFGLSEDEKLSLDLSEHFQLYYPDERTSFPSQNLPMQRALEGEETNDVDVVLWNPVAREKKRVLISGRPLIDQEDNVIAAVVTIKDISQYKQLEEELKATESKYRQLIGFRKEVKNEESTEERNEENTDSN